MILVCYIPGRRRSQPCDHRRSVLCRLASSVKPLWRTNSRFQSSRGDLIRPLIIGPTAKPYSRTLLANWKPIPIAALLRLSSSRRIGNAPAINPVSLSHHCTAGALPIQPKGLVGPNPIGGPAWFSTAASEAIKWAKLDPRVRLSRQAPTVHFRDLQLARRLWHFAGCAVQ